jgi:hypothetical protein
MFKFFLLVAICLGSDLDLNNGAEATTSMKDDDLVVRDDITENIASQNSGGTKEDSIESQDALDARDDLSKIRNNQKNSKYINLTEMLQNKQKSINAHSQPPISEMLKVIGHDQNDVSFLGVIDKDQAIIQQRLLILHKFEKIYRELRKTWNGVSAKTKYLEEQVHEAAKRVRDANTAQNDLISNDIKEYLETNKSP